jgi:hypothetical protein
MGVVFSVSFLAGFALCAVFGADPAVFDQTPA